MLNKQYALYEYECSTVLYVRQEVADTAVKRRVKASRPGTVFLVGIKFQTTRANLSRLPGVSFAHSQHFAKTNRCDEDPARRLFQLCSVHSRRPSLFRAGNAPLP